MPIMDAEGLSSLDEPYKECLEKVANTLDEAIIEAQRACASKGADDKILASAIVSTLLVTAASSAYIKFQSVDKDTLALCFVRAATEAMFGFVAPISTKHWR